MAYTYADFEKAANEAGMKGTFNQNDLSLAQRFPEYGLSLISLRRDLNNATTNEQKLLATEAENQLRKNYGSFNVTGSSYDGAGMPGTRGTQSSAGMPALSTAASGLNTQNTQSSATGVTGTAAGTQGTTTARTGAVTAAATGTATGTAGSAAATDTAGLTGTEGTAAESAGTETDEGPNPEEYTSDYVRMLDQVVNGQEPFSFDPFTDPRYSAYKKAYNREGDRAAANALATSAAATGGRPSSWANTAAQEANNYYAAKLADIIPTLWSEARGEYDKDFTQLMQRMNAAYQQERDQVADEQQDLQNAITIYQQTKTLVEPLKSMIEAAKAAEEGSRRGGGGLSYAGGGGGGGSKTPYGIGLEMGSKYGGNAAKVFAEADRSGLSPAQQASIYQGIVDSAGLSFIDK